MACIREKWIKLCSIQKEVCDLYQIPILNVADNCGINFNNIWEFYFCNNVHPNGEGYKRWAETLYKLLQNASLN